jgi:hypothetical protein
MASDVVILFVNSQIKALVQKMRGGKAGDPRTDDR